jgi:glutamyl-Q tRNA(Asp) synthetase
MSYRGRFAPSPSGRLHFGSLVAALGSWLRARAADGAWIVRIEDLDPAREIAGATADILATLTAFGLESDEAIVLQSARNDFYAAALRQLADAGLAYPCPCSRTDLIAFNGIHPRECVTAAASGRPAAWRVRVADETIRFTDPVFGEISQAIQCDVGDFVVRRADGGYSYQLAVVVDDAAQGVSEVVRGADLLDSTPRQIVLQRLLGFDTPGYLHLPLALDAQGRKLSKHDQARAVDPADPLPALRAALAFLDQRVPASTHIAGLLRAATDSFDITRIPRRNHELVAMRKD